MSVWDREWIMRRGFPFSYQEFHVRHTYASRNVDVDQEIYFSLWLLLLDAAIGLVVAYALAVTFDRFVFPMFRRRSGQLPSHTDEGTEA